MAARIEGARRWWPAWLGLHVAVFVLAMRNQLRLVTEACDGCPTVFRLSERRLDALRAAGGTVGEYRFLVAAVISAFALATVSLAWVLVRRANGEVMPIVLGYLLVPLGAARWVEDSAFLDLGWLSPFGRLVTFGNAVSLVVIFALFPDGRWRPQWSRIGVVVIAAWYGVVYASPFAGQLAEGRDPVSSIDAVVFVGGLVLIAACQVGRHRRAVDDRGPIRWVARSLGFAVVVFVPLVVLVRSGGAADPRIDVLAVALAIVGSFLVVGTTAAAILRHRLWDVELIVSRVIVYGGMTVAITAVYVMLVAMASRLATAHETPIALAGAIAVATALQPLRQRLQHVADRFVYGRVPAPGSLLEPLATMQRTDPIAGLNRTAELVATSLHLPRVTIEVEVPDTTPLRATAGTGHEGREPLEIPIDVDGDRLGRLVVAPRRGQRRFNRRDRRDLVVVATHVGAIAVMARTVVELQRSRASLLTAREEERRGLRRDLHDGLGPSLAVIAHRLERIRGSVPVELSALDHDLTEVEADVRSALDDVRRVARGLRPPVLDQLGLTGAIEVLGDELGLQVTVRGTVPDPLPAAVELAAYRIASEALVNARRHGGATSLLAAVAASGGALQLELTDDGVGLPAQPGIGVGLRSMQERAAELGGRCAVTATEGSGARVSIVLPLVPAGQP